MIIRSQNKKCIVNLSNIDMICAKSEEHTAFYVKEAYETDVQCYNGAPDSVMHLGTYSTEEKAIKVLDMIQDAYLRTTRVAISNDIEARCLPIAVAFQMPQDNEVQ